MRISARRQPRLLPPGQSLTHKKGGRLRAVLTSVDPVAVMVHREGEPDEMSWPIGRFDGRAELDVAFDFPFSVWFDGGAVWFSDLQADQSVELGEVEMFVSYDRPPPLSPEMRAIQRLQRQNQLERDRIFDRMAALERERNELKAQVIERQSDDETESAGDASPRKATGRARDKRAKEDAASGDDEASGDDAERRSLRGKRKASADKADADAGSDEAE